MVQLPPTTPQNLSREARFAFIGVKRMPYGRVDTIGSDQNGRVARHVGCRRRIAKHRHYPMPILLKTQEPEAGSDILITDPVSYRPQQQHLQSTTMDRILRPAVTGQKSSRLFGDQLSKFIEEPEPVQHQAALLLRVLVGTNRLAIGDDAQHIIKTLPKRGYLLEGPVSRDGKGADQLPRSPTDLPSIAVLAFVNLSQDPNQDYFCEGITEDIITELSRFSELLVIARNSSFQYKGRSVDVRQIGSELNARYILEGSIQSSDGTVRITAQLIDATREQPVGGSI